MNSETDDSIFKSDEFDIDFDILIHPELLQLNEEQQKHNLENDLKTNKMIVDKVKASDGYAEQLYAALCNNKFIQKENIFGIIKEEYWTCSWRYAGGIIAGIKETGDYLDWYCTSLHGNNISEGMVTDEIREDLNTIGWCVLSDDDIYL